MAREHLSWTHIPQKAFAHKAVQAELSHSITKIPLDPWAEEFDTDSFGRLQFGKPQPCCYSWS